MILIADIGATNIRFNLYQTDQLLLHNTLDSQLFSDFGLVIQSIISQIESEQSNLIIDLMVLGIPGVVRNNGIQNMMNTQWKQIEGHQIQEQFQQIKKVILLNDCVCMGYSMLMSFSQQDTFNINPSSQIDSLGNKVLICPGTGLGQCSMNVLSINQQMHYQVKGNEHGHALYAEHPQHYQFKQFIQNRLKCDYIYNEQLMAGPALQLFFQYVSQNKWNQITNEEITSRIYNQNKDELDIVCEKTVNLYLEVLFVYLSDICLAFQPMGGLYLVGSVIKSLFTHIQNNQHIFQNHFYLKNQIIRDILNQIPILVSREDNLGLQGALQYAKLQFN